MPDYISGKIKAENMKKASATGSRAASVTPLAGGKGGATMRHRLLLAVKVTFPFILAVAVL